MGGPAGLAALGTSRFGARERGKGLSRTLAGDAARCRRGQPGGHEGGIMTTPMSSPGPADRGRDTLGGPDPLEDEDELGGSDLDADTDELGGPDLDADNDELGGPDPLEDEDALGGSDPNRREDELG
jgi:hypothetical protein